MKKTIFILFAAFSFAACTPVYKDAGKPIERRVNNLLNKMTVDEMIAQMNLLPRWDTNDSSVRAAIARDEVGAILKASGVELNRSLQDDALKASRLGIPLMFHEDVIHGYRTIFPIPLAEACSWNPKQVQENSRMIAREAAAAGLQLTYAPMVDVSRDGRWGRIMETSGEDPYLSSVLAAARVRGFQGKDLSDPATIMACVKHFAGYAVLGAGRDYLNEEFSQRDLEELYLPPYRACIKENVGALMESYTMYDGIPVSYSKYLLTDVLRRELGYKGLLMTDWKTMYYAMTEGAIDTEEHSVEKAVNAGIQMDMTSEFVVKHLKNLYKQGKVSKKTIRDAAYSCLYAKFQMGLFDDPYRYFDEERQSREVMSDSIKLQALEAAKGSMVLLKNNGVLPIGVGGRVMVTGPMARAKEDLLGAWSACGKPEEVISPMEGCQEKFRVYDGAPTVIVCIGEPRGIIGEGVSTGKLEVDASQIALLRKYKFQGKKVVAVLFNGRPLCVGDILANCDALLEAWYPGTMGGLAVASVLAGEYNPSGRLVQTFPKHVGQVPIFYYPKRSFGHVWHCDIGDDPEFPFGYGLSYTTFEYSNLSVSADSFPASEGVEVSVDITNTGTMEGVETAQLYVADLVSSVIPREKMLKSFDRISLAPGQMGTVTFKLDSSAFEIYDENHKWTVEPGEFRIEVGANSSDTQSVVVTVR